MTASGAEPATAAAWAALIDCLPHATWVVALDTRTVVAANGATAALLAGGRSPVGLRAEELLATPEDLAYWAQAAAGSPGRLLSQAVLRGADGRSLHVDRCIAPLADGTGRAATHCVVSLVDRSAQQRAEDEYAEAVAELQATLEATADGILVTDLAGRVRSFNRRFAQIWGLPEELLEPRDDAAIQRWMCRCVSDGPAHESRLAVEQPAALLPGTERLVLHSGQVIERVTRPLWARGRLHGQVVSFRDISARIAADQRIEALSCTDALTGLPNRLRLADTVTAAVADWRRSGSATGSGSGSGFALLVVDLDRFRQVNDSLGHESGDRVLLDTARRIQGCMRNRDVLARVGGDQFAVLVHGADASAAAATARRVLNVVSQPSNTDGAQFTLTCSIGIAMCPQHGQTIDDLVRHGETAMRAVKAGGRGNYRFHQARADADAGSQMQLDHAMRRALLGGGFQLHYQPKVRLADGVVVGAEALIRWSDPRLGEISPAQFIPVAEESGFIVPVGEWVLSQAVRQATLWFESGREVPVAVNVSALQFQQPQFVDRVARVLAVSGLPPRLLELELTESILVRDAEEALQRLQALARLGVQLSIDDFGTGYSSLAYLKRFPIGKLKIDRSFVAGLPDDESDAGIVRAVLQMARALGKTVVAEGVETEAQRQFLQAAGCDEFQGFLCAPALDPAGFERHLPPSRRALPAPLAWPHIRLVR